MKKLLSLILSAGMMTSLLASCSSSSETPAGGTTTPSNTNPSTSTTGDENGLRVVVVSSPSGVDDGSFNQDIYNGAMQFAGENPGTVVTPVREENEANAVPAVADVVADYDVIVCNGFQFAGISTLALENPDKDFILVDSTPSNPDGSDEPYSADNIYSMNFAEQESGFFAGIAAALETKTNKVAVVNGIGYPSNVNYQFGFESGVNYANTNYGTDVEIVALASYAGTDVTGTNVGGNYTGSFADEATGKVVGEALLAEGVDIIFVAAGASGNGVFTAVKEHESAMVIGCDVDQYDDGETGTRNIILTTGLKVMSLNIYRQLNAVKDGTFAGDTVLLQADTDSTGFVSAEGRHQLADETISLLNDAQALLKDGTIVPAANFNGISSDNFPGMTQ